MRDDRDTLLAIVEAAVAYVSVERRHDALTLDMPLATWQESLANKAKARLALGAAVDRWQARQEGESWTTTKCAKHNLHPVIETLARGRHETYRRWLQEHHPEVFTEQRHTVYGTPERAYWHHGYMMAIRDLLAWVPDEQDGGNDA